MQTKREKRVRIPRIAESAVLVFGAAPMATSKKNDRYRDTLQLPKTAFSMRADLLNKEPSLQRRWEAMNLYNRVLARVHPRGDFVFHDGPPYANGTIHMGHLLNKILKDIVVRSRLMAGYEVRFVPGWDCHGLPIEHKVMKEIGEEAAKLTTMEIRERCAAYAQHFQQVQAEQMIRLGTVGDYESPYLTMHPSYEGAVLEAFAALVGHGLVYRDLKPVHWSIENRTALAEAELEYYDRDDISVFVFFEVADADVLPESLNAPAGERIELMIWTTTPWTLPANLAVAVALDAEYDLVRVSHLGDTRHVVIAENLRSIVLPADGEVLGRCRGFELVTRQVRYRHPFIDRISPVVSADYVSLDDGTGMVHTAPGHGQEDYETGIAEGLDIYCPVQGDGTFDDSVPDWLQGKSVWEANPLVVERLVSSGHLFRQEDIVHSYPHDWRGKTPTIFRATEQWFVSVDQKFGDEQRSLRERAIDATETGIEFVPDWGRNRMRGMLDSRPDWCISRQRSWGLPIPCFDTEDGKVLLTEATVRAVAQFVRAHGSDAWFTSDPAAILEHYDPAADDFAPEAVVSGGREGLTSLTKGSDIFDVWFESGSSWNGVLRERDIGYPADLYLEGSDQHRGWFQTSMLPALGATGESPFRAVVTHGFTLAADGHKMSKSLGNAIEVEDLLSEHGADVCRWWTASVNYTLDIKVDWEFFRVASDEYRKVRNTLRFMLGNLVDYDPAEHRHQFTDDDRTAIDSWAMQRLARLVATVREAYDTYQYKRVSESIFEFCNDAMSAVYLAAAKDRLYCDAASSPRRRRAQTVLFDAADALIRMLAPILVHTSEEAWLALHGKDLESDFSIHLEFLPEPFEWPANPDWDVVMQLRGEVLKQLELAKEDPGISNPLDAGVVAELPADELARLEPYGPELADLCGVSRFELKAADDRGVRIVDLRDQPRCERSWKRDGTVRERSDGGTLSDRDAAVLGLE
jgi:isoleucyl-tRNA synthetase